MSESEQIDAFSHDLDALVSRYANEFNLTNAAAVGVLEIKKHRLIREAIGDDDED